jgi:DNA-binding MarR family transcriptional regulator
MTAPQLPPRLDARVAYLLGRVAALAAQRANAELAQLDLDTRHYAVLAAVETAAGPSQRMIADLLGIDRATVVGLTDNLQQRRLLRRVRSDQDRRAYALQLTQAGRRLVGKAHTLMDKCDQELMVALPETARAELAATLRTLLLRAGAPTAAADPPPTGKTLRTN